MIIILDDKSIFEVDTLEVAEILAALLAKYSPRGEEAKKEYSKLLIALIEASKT